MNPCHKCGEPLINFNRGGEKPLVDFFVGFRGTSGLWHPVNIRGDYELELYGDPTHWMPLPEPPQES